MTTQKQNKEIEDKKIKMPYLSKLTGDEMTSLLQVINNIAHDKYEEGLKQNVDEINKGDECCFENCKNKAVAGVSHNPSKGSINMCEECLDFYKKHLSSRENRFREIVIKNKFEKGFKAGQRQLLDDFEKMINEISLIEICQISSFRTAEIFIKELKQKLNSLSKKEGVEE